MDFAIFPYIKSGFFYARWNNVNWIKWQQKCVLKKGDYAEKVWPFPYACYIYVHDVIWRWRSGSCKKHQQDLHVCETQMPLIMANSKYGQDHKDKYLDTKDLVSRNAHVQYESCSLYYFVWMLIIPPANEVGGGWVLYWFLYISWGYIGFTLTLCPLSLRLWTCFCPSMF